MRAVPELPSRLSTIEAYAGLGADDRNSLAWGEGELVESPGLAPEHMTVMAKLLVQLNQQLPSGLLVIPDVDVDLGLAPRGRPDIIRRADLIVVHQAALERARSDGGLLCAGDVMVIIEVVAPDSRRTDYVIKCGEYAEAGIPHYWIVDIDGRITLTDCHLAGVFGYQNAGPVTDRFITTVPFPVSLNLDDLLPG